MDMKFVQSSQIKPNKERLFSFGFLLRLRACHLLGRAAGIPRPVQPKMARKAIMLDICGVQEGFSSPDSQLLRPDGLEMFVGFSRCACCYSRA